MAVAVLEPVRRDLRAVLWIVPAVLVVSLVGGGVWGLLAPTEKSLVVSGGRDPLPLTGESVHRFDAVAIFACVGVVAGLLSAAAVWRRRAARGPSMLAGLLLGSLAGAWLMSWFGEQVAGWIHPQPHNPPVRSIVELAPGVEGWTVLLLQPLLAGLVVLVLSALSTSEDLGRGDGSDPADEPRATMSDVSYGPYAWPSGRPTNGPCQGSDSGR
ncbi:DUF2567 domain-containing protein [Nocardia sp. NPDC052254]|uniref:DUF2567 domain-containing protein n=1 Tax=Nocardia sp. NPDC052254 TaxID=3155681 RepID=UPI00342B07B8